MLNDWQILIQPITHRTKNQHIGRNNVYCPGCFRTWNSLIDLTKSGGKVYSIGLKLCAECPDCGCEWGCNRNWYKTKEIILEDNR